MRTSSVASLLLLCVLAGCCPDTLPVVLRPQETADWCWAAAEQTIAEYVSEGAIYPQCELVAEVADAPCPCNPCSTSSAIPQHCQIGGYPDFTRINFDVRELAGSSLTNYNETELAKELCSGVLCGKTPVAFAWISVDQNGNPASVNAAGDPVPDHILVAAGYKKKSGTGWVYVRNPWPVCTGDSEWIRYSEFAGGAGYVLNNVYDHIRKRAASAP